MSKRAIVLTLVITALTALPVGTYLWIQAAYVLPAASCGQWAMPGQPSGTPGAAQCFAAAARTCAVAGVRVHFQGTESATDHVFVLRAGRTPGRCQVTDYLQERSIGEGRVETQACQASVTGTDVTISCHGATTAVIGTRPPAPAPSTPSDATPPASWDPMSASPTVAPAVAPTMAPTVAPTMASTGDAGT